MKRTFGTVRQLPSGRFQARYWYDGTQASLEGTFETRKLAEKALADKQSDLGKGIRPAPGASKVTVRAYAAQWLEERSLEDRTREEYQGLLDRHILTTFGDDQLGAVMPSKVRSWNARLVKRHPTTAAKAYRLLRTIFATAVTDDVIGRNPCRVERAGVERAPERPVATLAELDVIVEAMPERFRALVLVAVWCQLRRGELLGLHRRDIDVARGTVSVVRSRQRLKGQGVSFKDPKSRAGRRTITIPAHVLPAIAEHLERFVEAATDAIVFTGEQGRPLSPPQFHKYWNRARLAAGRPELHLHDLRHTGNTWAASTGVPSTKQLMYRMGHDSPRAALMYQHATEDQDRVVADALAAFVAPAPVVPITKARRAL